METDGEWREVTKRASVLLFSVLCSFVLAPESHAQAAATPEAAIRAMITAMYANDVTAYNTLTLPNPKRAMLTTGGRVLED